MTIKELKEKRAKLISDARAFYEARQAAGSFTDDDQATYDKHFEEVEKLDKQIENIEKLERQEAKLNEIRAEREKPGGDERRGEHRDGKGNPITADELREREQAYEEYIRTGERRNLKVGVDAEGGYLQPSQQMMEGFLKNVDDMVHVRRLARRETLAQAESLGILTLNDPDDFNWTSELLTGAEDASLSFGKREFRPQPLAKRIKVSRTLLRKASRSPVEIINERFAYKLGTTLENTYLTGTGANQPLGVFTASADGISTARDVSTDMTSTAMTADGLIEVKYTLKGQYWAGARWMFHRDGVKQIAKLKDGEGQYIFDVTRNTLLGFPIDVNEFAPNTFTASQYVGILANWNQYLVLDTLSLSTQRLDELYAATNQVGFIMRYEGDGQPLLEEGFVRVKLAA